MSYFIINYDFKKIKEDDFDYEKIYEMQESVRQNVEILKLIIKLEEENIILKEKNKQLKQMIKNMSDLVDDVNEY